VAALVIMLLYKGFLEGVSLKAREKGGVPRGNPVQGLSQTWRCTSIIPVLRRLRQEDQEFKASLDFTTSCEES
jgi:hypothetical protein